MHRKWFFLLLAVGCTAEFAPDATDVTDATDNATHEAIDSMLKDDSSARRAECVIDTIQLRNAIEFSKDLEAAFDPQWVIDFGANFYKQVHLAGAFESPLVPTNEFGTYVYSLHGWDVVPLDLVRDFSTRSGLYASIQAEPPISSTLPFERKKYAVAKSIFDAMTRARETRTDHVVPPEHVYDRSWTKIRRASPNDRLICEKLTYTASTRARPTYTCVLSKVEWKTVQSYDRRLNGGFCPAF